MDSKNLIFKNISIKHKEKIESLALLDGTKSCQHTFANINSLQEIYKTQVAFYNEMVILRIPIMDELGYEAYRFPFGSTKILDTVQRILEYTKNHDKKCLFYNITDGQRQLLESEMKNKWNFEGNRNWAEYIYKAEKFNAYLGDKLRKKRQHLQKFKKIYDNRYLIETISKNNIEEVKFYQKRWLYDKVESQENSVELRTTNLHFENKKIFKELDSFYELGLQGITLRIDGIIRGYCYGTVITDDTIDYLVLKGDRDIQGAYTMLTHSFVLKCYNQGYKFINFEEDIGLPGLRQMKNSYVPDLLLCKHVAREV